MLIDSILRSVKRTLVFAFLFIFSQIKIMAQEKPILLYFGDPMCSWCYGFSPEFGKVAEAVKGIADIRLVMGGLRPYNTETMADLGEFLTHHWDDVGRRSGQPFRFDILQKQDIVYDTEPACRAVVTAANMDSTLAFPYFKAVQTAFYFENKDPNLTKNFVELAGTFNLDKKVFEKLFESEEMKNAVREDFATAAEMGVRGFPTVVLKNGDDFYLLTNGYALAEGIIEKITTIIDR